MPASPQGFQCSTQHPAPCALDPLPLPPSTQFVIISLRNNMFELAERLVGIYKTDNATKTVAINPGQFALRNQQAQGQQGQGQQEGQAEQAGANQGPPVVQAMA